MKQKNEKDVITIDRIQLYTIYLELQNARKPLLRFEFDDQERMMREAMCAKDRAIDWAISFLYNEGVENKG